MISIYYNTKNDLLNKFLLSLEMCTKSCLGDAYQSKIQKNFIINGLNGIYCIRVFGFVKCQMVKHYIMKLQ